MAGFLTEISHSLNGGTATTSGIPLSASHTLNLDLVNVYNNQFPSITSDGKGVVLSTLVIGVKDESSETKTQSYQIARDPHRMIILYPAVATLGTAIHGKESIRDFLCGGTSTTLKARFYQPIVRNSNNTGYETGSLSVAQANDLFVPGVNCNIGLSLTYTKLAESNPRTLYVDIPVSATEWTLSGTQNARGKIGGSLPAATFTTGNAPYFEIDIFDSVMFLEQVVNVFSDYTLANIKPSTNVTMAVFAYLGPRISGISSTAPSTLVDTWSYSSTTVRAFSRTRARPADVNNVDIAVSTVGSANPESLPDSGGFGWVGEYDSNVATDTTVKITATANV